MFDAAIAGSNLVFKSFAMVFNPNLSVHVNRLTSFAFTYVRFTSDLVPTSMTVEMSLEIMNMGTKSYVTSGGAAGAGTGAAAVPATGTVAAGTAAPPGTTGVRPIYPLGVPI